MEYVFARRNTHFYKVSLELVRWLNAHIGEFDVVHIHALFSFSSTVAAHIAHRGGVPYIVRPLGVLNEWGLKNRRAFLKQMSLALIEKRILTRAAAIHYTSEAERTEAGKIGEWAARVPSFVTALPVAAPPRVIGDQLSIIREEVSKSEIGSQLSDLPYSISQLLAQLRGKRIVLFLSRIDPKKGIELLLSAFANVRHEVENLVLVIAGSGESKYEASLRNKAEEMDIAQDVIWPGFVAGDEKQALLAAAEIFVLPSYSENFGIAAAEALAAGIPCILSDQVGLADQARQANAALVCRADERGLAQKMKQLLTSSELRETLRAAARKFTSQSLSPEAIGAQLEAEYRRAIGARVNG